MNKTPHRRISSRSGEHYSAALLFNGESCIVLGYENGKTTFSIWENLDWEAASEILDSVMTGKFPPGATRGPLPAPRIAI